ncbi:copper amine oxidase N-terminal domain-containing protein [bacterium]|nr:MAG: copper amine oxidase N-terminal domain-containing protein [bacterium]
MMKTLNLKQTGLMTLALGATLAGAANAQGGFNNDRLNNDRYGNRYNDRNDRYNDGAPRLMLNGRPFETRVQPIVQDGRVLVPLRDIFENLGARVNYDNGTIVARRDGTRVQMRLGSDRARVDGRSIRLDVPAMSVGGATMVPLRFVSEALGATVNFNQNRNVVRINDRDKGRDDGRLHIG